MKRFKLRCNHCEQVIGFMPLPYDVPRDIIDSTKFGIDGEKEPILCPMCELERLRGEKNVV